MKAGMNDEAMELLRECCETIDYLRTEANLQYGRELQKRILKFLAQSKAAPIAWIAIGSSGRVIRFFARDGWKVDTVMTELKSYEASTAPANGEGIITQEKIEKIRTNKEGGYWDGSYPGSWIEWNALHDLALEALSLREREERGEEEK